MVPRFTRSFINWDGNDEIFYRRKTSFPNSNRNGHPREDQKVGLKIGGKEYVEIEKQENEDEPPFNFQVRTVPSANILSRE